ncbi:MAG: argonaute/piwi family protein [Acidimicrobiales bacterium]
MSTATAVQLTRPVIETTWLPEPTLTFADRHTDIDQKIGLAMWGPSSLGTPRHPDRIRLAVMGPSRAVEHAAVYVEDLNGGVDGDDHNQPFPGMTDTFKTKLVVDPHLDAILTASEIGSVRAAGHARQQFEALEHLVNDKFRALAEHDHPPDLVILALDDDLYGEFRTVDYSQDKKRIHRDLRRAVKARAMRYRLPTQLLQESTTRLVTKAGRSLDHAAEVAWNLGTGMFFKGGGLPWLPSGLSAGTCYIGISFYRPLGERSTLTTSVVQAFDENGDGLVLRGHNFRWDPTREERSAHLPEDAAAALIEMVLDRYRGERKQLPRRVVVHKSSWYEPAELAGFRTALRSVDRHDLLALRQTSDWRLMRMGKYPPLRGTVLSAGDHSMLYTNGWVGALGYDHGHVPAPLEITDHRGDTGRVDLLREVLTLTKMNWNSSAFAESQPITLRFSRQVGEILREVPAEEEPQPQYRYYM